MDADDRLHLVLSDAAMLDWRNSIDLAETADGSSRFSIPGLSPDEVHDALKDARHAGLFAGEPHEGDGSMRTWFQPHLTLAGLQSVGAWPTHSRPATEGRWWRRAQAALVKLRDDPPYAGHISAPLGTNEPTSPIPDTDERTYWLLLAYMLESGLIRAERQQSSLEDVAITPAGRAALGSEVVSSGPRKGLTPEQRKLLDRIVEIARELPAHDRQFRFEHRASPARVVGAGGIDFRVLGDDLSQLVKSGLLKYTSQNYVTGFDFVVTAAGFDAYDLGRKQMADRMAAVERDTTAYLRGGEMADRFPKSYRLWLEADQDLSSGTTSPTVVGHTIREAMQMFATELLTRHGVNDSSPPTQTVNRARAVLNNRKADLGKDRAAVLDALLNYWGTVADLSQRLEHGAQKEGETVKAEDARQLVHLSGQVMYEFSRTLG
jgi:hypothetical protein